VPAQAVQQSPAETNVVYVPQYDPWLVYGAPLAMFPGWYPYPGLYWDAPGVGFGVGLFGSFGWGWHNWGFDWRHGGRVVRNHNTYMSHSTTIVNRNSFHMKGAQQCVQTTFPSAAEASQSLFRAVQSNNEQAIASTLGGATASSLRPSRARIRWTATYSSRSTRRCTV
jgi:hypothetical protein